MRLLSRHGGPGPQFVLAVEADLDNPYLRTGISVGRGTALGLEPLSRQVSRLARPDRAVVAAVNGDFFYYPSREQPGIPTGATVLGDEVVRTPFRRSALILPPVGTPRIAILNLTGSVRQQDRLLPLSGVNQPRKSGDLVLYTPWFGSTTRTDATGLEIELEPEAPMLQHGADLQVRVAGPPRAAGNSPISASRWVLSGSGASQNFLRELQAGAILTLRLDFDPPVTAGEQVIAGGPRLMREGRVAVEAEGGSLNGAFVTSRHPRTAVGIAGRRLLLVTVDGRQPGFSAGMSLPELAEEMRRLGCTDALNLDGGGSTTFWVRGLIANQPSDGRERPVANGLVLFSTAPYGGPARLACTPREVHALPGARVPVAVLAEDQHYNLVAPPVPLPIWEAPLGLGAVENCLYLAPERVEPPDGAEALTGSLSVTAEGKTGALRVRLYRRPARVQVLPATARVRPGSRTRFRVRAQDSLGRELFLPAQIGWNLDPAVGLVAPDGTVAAGPQAAEGMLEAVVAGVTASVPVQVTAP